MDEAAGGEETPEGAPETRDLAAELAAYTFDLMAIPGLSGHEGRVRRRLAADLKAQGLSPRTDRLGNLIVTRPGDASAPSVLLIAHMDQLGFVVRRIDPSGFLRIERVGGVPERALPAQAVSVRTGDGRYLPGVIANKSHHATTPEERSEVLPTAALYVDLGVDSAAAARAAGVEIGAPVVYAPRTLQLTGGRIAGTSIDDRAACAVLVAVMAALGDRPAASSPTVHGLFSVQEEFNLRGALPAARALAPDICLQLDLALASDTPDMADRGEVQLGGGPVMSLYSFHGRGTLNGLIPHPALVRLMTAAAAEADVRLQRSAQIGALTETSYVQLLGEGVACLDLGFPCRYTHSALEVCDPADLADLARLLSAALARIGPGFSLNPDDVAP